MIGMALSSWRAILSISGLLVSAVIIWFNSCSVKEALGYM